MLRLIFTIPLVLCLVWFIYLKYNNWTIEEGKKGFIYILSFSLIIGAFFTFMLFVTSE